MDAESSVRLNLLRFPLIVGVVFIHSYDSTINLSSNSVGMPQSHLISDVVRNLISQVVARTAVPLFYLMSGYLFFTGFQWSFTNYYKKLQSRTKSLLIPFLFWNIATLFFMALAQSLPATRNFFSGKVDTLISNFRGLDYLYAIFGVGRSPIAYQFWFVRDLMLFILFVPLIHFSIRLIPYLFASILFVLWLSNSWLPYSRDLEAALFFFTGSVLAQIGRGLFSFDKFGATALAICAITATAEAWESSRRSNEVALEFLHKINICFLAISLLYLTKLANKYEHLKNPLLWLGRTSFFVYAAHEPLLTVARKATYKILPPHSSAMVLLSYFTLPAIVITSLVILYEFMLRLFPQFTRIITGGR